MYVIEQKCLGRIHTTSYGWFRRAICKLFKIKCYDLYVYDFEVTLAYHDKFSPVKEGQTVVMYGANLLVVRDLGSEKFVLRTKELRPYPPFLGNVINIL